MAAGAAVRAAVNPGSATIHRRSLRAQRTGSLRQRSSPRGKPRFRPGTGLPSRELSGFRCSLCCFCRLLAGGGIGFEVFTPHTGFGFHLVLWCRLLGDARGDVVRGIGLALACAAYGCDFLGPGFVPGGDCRLVVEGMLNGFCGMESIRG